MLKQQFSGVKKVMAILLTVFFVVSLTAGAVSACGASPTKTCSSCNHVNACSSCTASGHACSSCAAAGHTCKSCGSKSCHSKYHKHHSCKSKSCGCSAGGCTV